MTIARRICPCDDGFLAILAISGKYTVHVPGADGDIVCAPGDTIGQRIELGNRIRCIGIKEFQPNFRRVVPERVEDGVMFVG